ncbi:serine/threonine-protein kinase [Gemmata sp. JC673]|uniref:Serine/threonine-protein kinase n=1 Tax=Gemmata algarum TaxID=2975278 RepID=A0ABU5EUQ9_9BACT|nr:serine/threonine-protein kinase [Gemmata algarum]MDY3558871.1 serine/threonine-protein kinase [Gemmata algarum]
MSACPPPDQLQGLIDGTLGAAAHPAVEEHVNGCPACQQALERLTEFPPLAPAGAAEPPPDAFLARVLAAATAGPPAPAPATATVAAPDVPGYEVAGELGRGGMGVVYRARHRRLNRTVALKVLTDAGLNDPAARSRFLTEAEAVARLQHPHIVQVYEFGEHAGRPYLAMEFADGGSLAEHLARGRTFPPARAAELVARVADAVAAAHAKGVIHRDLKPSNILLGGEPGDPAPKVADFGIARVGRSEMTATGELLGTPSYMAPEQAAGRHRDIGTYTDVHGLGAILYELLTGRPPFLGDTVVDTLQRVVRDRPRPPRALARGVPRDLETICLKCLEKAPGDRYPTADAVAADLRAYLCGGTISARPARAWERGVRLIRRHPVPFAALLLIAATVGAAFVLIGLALRVALVAQSTAEKNRQEAIEARLKAELGATKSALEQALALCEAGSVDRGLSGLDEVLNAAQRIGNQEPERVARLNRAARGEFQELERVARLNRAAWGEFRSREEYGFDRPDPARPVTVAVFTDDGRALVTGSRRGGALRVWDLDDKAHGTGSLRELAPPDPARPGVVAAFPEPDRRLRVVYESGHVSEWDLQTGTAVRHDLAFEPDSPIRSAGATLARRAVSGRLVGIGSADGSYRVWDLDRRRLLARPDGETASRHFYTGTKRRQSPHEPPALEPGPAPGAVTGLEFPDNGNMLLTAGEQEGVILLGLPSPNRGSLFEPVQGGRPNPAVTFHQFDLGGEVLNIRVGPDRQTFLAGGASAVSLWTIHDRERPLWVNGHPDRVTALAFSTDRRRCATADRGGVVRCWDVTSGALLAELRLPSPVLALQFPPDKSDNLLVGGADGSSVLWRLPAQLELRDRAVEPTPLGPGIVIRIGPRAEQAIRAAGFEARHGGEWAATARKVEFWSGDRAAAARKAELWPGAPPRLSIRPAGEGTALAPQGVSVSPDGRWLVTAVQGSGAVSVYDLSRTPPDRQSVPAARAGQVAFVGPRSFVTVAEPGPDGDSAGELVWWELDEKGGAGRLGGWPAAEVSCLAPHPGGGAVLIGYRRDRRARLWNLASGAEVGPGFPHPGPVTAAAVAPGGDWAATGGQDGSVRLWPLSGEEWGGRAPQHAGRVNALAFGTGPSHGVLATASADGTARFWDARTGCPLGPPLRHPTAVLSVAFGPDGTRVITGTLNGYAKIWPAPDSATR